MATERKSLIDVDGTAGVDCDYESLDAWEDDLGAAGAFLGTGGVTSGDLVTDNEIAVAQCRNSSGSADTAAVYIQGWTTGASNYILVEAYTGYRHSGVLDLTKYYLYNNNAHTYLITATENYVRFDGIQVSQISSSGALRFAFYPYSIGAGGSDLRFSNLIIKEVGSGTIATGGIWINDSDATVTAYNNVIYGFINGAAVNHYGIYSQSATALNAYNNTISNCYIGIKKTAGTCVYKNNIVFNNTDDFNGGDTIDYNASDDGDGTNAISPSGGDWANEMPDYATDDFTLISTGNCYQAGLNDPSGSGYGDPAVNGVSRPTAPTGWSIGAFESAGAGGRASKNTDAFPLGMNVGMSFRM